MAPIRIGVIGCGAVAQVQHLPNLTALKDLFSVEIVCDLSPSLAQTVAEEFHVPALYQRLARTARCRSRRRAFVPHRSQDRNRRRRL